MIYVHETRIVTLVACKQVDNLMRKQNYRLMVLLPTCHKEGQVL
jgi:hypothetical protein